MVSLLFITPIANIAILPCLIYNDFLLGLTQGKHEEHFNVRRDIQVAAKLGMVNSRQYAAGQSLFAGSQHDALGGNPMIAVDIGADGRITEHYDIGRRPFAFFRAFPVFQVCRPGQA